MIKELVKDIAETQKQVIDLTPSWETTARILVEVLKHGETAEARELAETDLVKLGKLLDSTVERTKLLTDQLSETTFGKKQAE